MRTSTSLAALLLANVAACNWTEFDDLKDEATVIIDFTPNSASTDYGVALVRGQRPQPAAAPAGQGGKLVAYGSGDPQFFKLDLAPSGEIEVQTAIELVTYTITNLDAQPVLIADPGSDEVALATKTGNDHISFIRGGADDNLEAAQMFNVNTALTANYVIAPTQTLSKGYAIGTTDDTNSTLVRPRVTPDEAVQPRCDLLDTAGGKVRARGTAPAYVTSTTSQDIVVWGADGKLLVYPGAVYLAQFDGDADFANGVCPGTMLGGEAKPLAMKELDTGYQPSIGSKIIFWKDDYVILVGHGEFSAANPTGFIGMYKLNGANTAITPVGNPNMLAGVRAADLLTIGAKSYVVAGYPGTLVDGIVAAGQIQAWPIGEATGVEVATPAQIITRRDPGKNEQLGRAIAVTDFNGSQIITAGADGKVFFYFATSLYEDAREK